ncbi:MAG: glycosyltransferase [Eubacteriales bacterium]|nr:glycosyltransferase [Eubacteriales bacterium]
MAWLRVLVEFLNVCFFFYMLGYSVFLFMSAIGGAVAMHRKAKTRTFRRKMYLYHDDNYIPVSILVPAYNEEVTILDTVHSLRQMDYPEYEIIVVDDGSSDDTAKRLIEEFHLIKAERPIQRRIPTKKALSVWESVGEGARITLICKENGGKADALNMGINASRYSHFVSIDADSVLQPTAVRRMMEAFLEDKRVVACGGMIQIANQATIVNGEVKEQYFPKKIIVLLQMLEYCRSFLGSRILFDFWGGNMIISGACGMFKKELVLRCGGYDSDIIGEDMELVVKLHHFCRSNRIDYKIVHEQEAICWTQVPESLNDLRKQRRRWHTGMIQSILLHKDIIFNPEYGLVSFFSMTYYLLMECLGPVIEIVGAINILLAIWLEMIDYEFMITYFFLFIFFSAVVTMITFFSRMYITSSRATEVKLSQVAMVIAFSFIECLGFRQLISIFRTSAFFNYRKNKNEWGKITRKEHNRGVTNE